MQKLLLFCFTFFFSLTVFAQNADPLPAWNNGPVKTQIINFVRTITNKSNPAFIPPSDRIATFDNDGTLWLEQPVYTQFIFAYDRIKQLAATHPEWKTQQPYSKLLQGDMHALATLKMQDIEKILAESHTGMTVEAFKQIVQDWLATTKNLRFQKTYPRLIYQPMRELMQYLRANEFKVYIVTGGGQDFVRAYSQPIYGVSTEQVIGTSGKTHYVYQHKQPELIKLPEILLIDDKAGKPEAINLFIGKKPVMAFGNSDGDREMLEWTQSGKGKRFMLLVHHDDAEREYAYGPDSKVGTFSNALMSEAKANGWQVVSMKNDWKQIFPFSTEK